MDDPPTALAAVFAQCLLASVQFEAQVRRGYSDAAAHDRIKLRALAWFNDALKIGEEAAERQVQQRGGYQD